MPIPWIIGNLYGLHKRRRADERGEQAFATLREQLLQQGGGVPLTPAQEQQVRLQSDPGYRFLMGTETAQQSALPPAGGQDFTSTIDRAEAVKQARGGKAGFEYLLGHTDPAALAQLQAQKTQNAQQKLAFTRQQQQHLAQAQNLEDIGAGAFEGIPPEARSPLAAMSPTDTGRTILRTMGIGPGSAAADTSQIKNYKFRQKLESDDKPVFDSMFRQQQVIDTGGGGKSVLAVGGEMESLVTPQQFGQSEGLSNIERDDLRRRYGEQVALPEIRAKAKQMIKIGDEALAHKGFNSYYGIRGALPTVPGSAAADFETWAKQGQGNVFLQAYESLKGGGQITQIEGDKAEAAKARIFNRRQSPESARQAWNDIITAVRSGLKRAEESASTSYGITGPRQTPVTEPTVTGGYRIIERR